MHMDNGRSYPAFELAMVFFKGLVWAGLAFGSLALVVFVFDLAPYALAPFYLNWPQRWPGGIETRMSDAELKRRIAILRAAAASPQAAANAATSLTIVGVEFDRLRAAAAKSTTVGTDPGVRSDGAAEPFPIALDLSRSNRSAVVVLVDQSTAWSIVPPWTGRPQALFGIESRLFPVLMDPPPGVLAGFRIGTARDHNIAQPLRPDEGASGDVTRFCTSIVEWARFFSVPLSTVRYVLVQDPKTLTFDGSNWTSDGSTLLELDNQSLRNGCVKYGNSDWKYGS